MTLCVPTPLCRHRYLSVLSMLVLASCGGSGIDTGTGTGSGSDGGSSPATSSTPAEGTLLESPGQLISTVTAPSLLVELNLATNQQLLSLSGSPVSTF